ncbi:MAG: hypothetical protein KC592_06285 [Nitrospira sp.]|nr:hypothetical protein [Nitrospira sp.]HNP29426.1 hypothetical protein [Nitrospirales bacterium]
MKKNDTPSILLASLSIGLVWLYFALVLLLGRSIGGMSVGLTFIASSIPFVASLVFILIRYVMHRGLIKSQQILTVSLGLILSLGSLIIADIAYSLYLNSRAFEKPHIENSRQYDPAFVGGELYPRRFFPTDENFWLYKPNLSVKGTHYGHFYHPELMQSPILAKSVFELHQFSCSIDQHGLRNTTPMGQADVLALGDSFTFGWAMDREKSWVGLLEHAIHRPIYNLGIDGASPKQELELLKYLLRTQEPSMRIRKILWMIYEGNDLEGSYESERPKPSSPSYTNQLFKGTLVQGLITIPSLIKEQAIITKLLNGDVALRFPTFQARDYNPYVIDGIRSWFPFFQSPVLGPRLFYPKYIEEAQQPLSYVLHHPNTPHLNQVFREMALLEKEFSFQVIVIIVPTGERLHGPFYENFPPISAEPHFIDYVSKVSESLGFQTLNLLSKLKPYADNELLYFRDDSHWNQRGHELAAEIIRSEVFQQ